MKRILMASAAIMLLAAPSYAWDTTTTPPTQTQTQTQHQQAQGGAGGSGGAGGAGGSAASSARSSSHVVNNISTTSGGGVAQSGNGGGNGWLGNQAPDVSIPSIGGGGSDCPVVGFGVGGSGLGGGGGFGPSWISADCNTRKLAELLSRLGYRDAAISVLADHFPEVKRAMTPVSAPTAAPFPVPVVAPSKPDWCATSSPAERHRHKECM